MTEKRFKLIGDSNLEMLMQHQPELPIYDYNNKKKRLSLSDALNLLNSLHEENEELKHFKDKTFDLFDKEITGNEEAMEEVFGKQGVSIGAMGFYTNMLKILRKELRE